MFVTIRYILVFLISLSLFSVRGESHLLLGDVSSVQVWGNHGEVFVEEGSGRIGVEGLLGGSFLFVAPGGKCFVYCLGSCRIRLGVPENSLLALYFNSGDVYVDGVSHLLMEMNKGRIATKNVQKSDVSLFRGSVDALVPEDGSFFLRGQYLDGDIYTLGDGYSHVVHRKGEVFSDIGVGENNPFVQVQFFDGNLNIFTDSFAKHF
jgi:hypothetical protein